VCGLGCVGWFFMIVHHALLCEKMEGFAYLVDEKSGAA
jgi:hypothetical protein